MSELIYNAEKRKELLKHMILQLHSGEAPEQVKKQLKELMMKIPYNEVVEVEQELISEGLPVEEVLRLCDIHTQALEGNIDLSGAKTVPAGHPVDTFRKENLALTRVVELLELQYSKVLTLKHNKDVQEWFMQLKALFNSLMDVDKHYRRKENLLFPYLEKYGITGPPKVMWGKHDEARAMLKSALNAIDTSGVITTEEAAVIVSMLLRPASTAISGMIIKEEQILLPMTLDHLTDSDWYEIYRQTDEIGYCLYDPKEEWKPEGILPTAPTAGTDNLIRLPSGSFSTEELLSVLNTLPVDMTFVDKHDKVRYFSQGKERIFDRNRAILGRDVRMCHPPSSVHIVEQILDDFKSGRQQNADFWIQMRERFIHIEYFALRNKEGEYLGTLEVSQDLTEKRALKGEQRILSYKS